jgi:DNA-binding IclR family transcriptional regulator
MTNSKTAAFLQDEDFGVLPEKSSPARLSSVTTAIRLLKQFDEKQVELGISALSRNLGVAKSTVHRVASTLVAEGLLEQDSETELYRLGLGLFSLGALVRQRLSVTTVAKELLTHLRDEFRENVELAVLKDHQVTYLYDFESPRPVRLRTRLGMSLPAVDCAVGMAIVAYQSPPRIQELISASNRDLSAADLQSLQSEIEQIQTDGFVTETENFELGAVCVATPIYSLDGSINFACGITVPHQRAKPKTIEHMANRLLETSALISKKLGFVPERTDWY